MSVYELLAGGRVASSEMLTTPVAIATATLVVAAALISSMRLFKR